jgi:uncharacterized protein with HEPN domain
MVLSANAALADILAEIDAIEAAVAGRSLEEFRREWMFRRAVERGIEIISEASRRLPSELQQRRPEVPWKEIMGIGSVLRHEYHRTSEFVVWGVATHHLRTLRPAIEALRLETDR